MGLLTSRTLGRNLEMAGAWPCPGSHRKCKPSLLPPRALGRLKPGGRCQKLGDLSGIVLAMTRKNNLLSLEDPALEQDQEWPWERGSQGLGSPEVVWEGFLEEATLESGLERRGWSS